MPVIHATQPRGGLHAVAQWGAAFLARLTASPRLRALQPALQFAFALGLIGYLAYCLIPLGLAKIWESRPDSWLFYALLPLSFLLVPVCDLIIYRRLWRAGRALTLSVILRKHFANAAVVDLSGEAYLYMWGRRHLALSHGFLFQTIKDSKVLAAIAGWSVMLGLMVFLAASGHWMIPYVGAGDYWLFWTLAGVLVALAAAMALTRRGVAVLDRRQIAFTFAVHMVRVLASNALLIALWAAALPSVSLVVWLNFLLIRNLAIHLGFLQRRDLLLLATGVGAAAFLGLPQAAVAALLLVMTASGYALNLLFLGLPTLAESLRMLLAAPRAALNPARRPPAI